MSVSRWQQATEQRSSAVARAHAPEVESGTRPVREAVDAACRRAREEVRNLSGLQLEWQARRLRRQTTELHVSGLVGPADLVAFDAVRDGLGARGGQVSA